MSSKTDWTNFFDMDFWEFYCKVFNEDGDPIFPDDPGKAAYTAVNTERYDRNLPTTDTVPNETYDSSTGQFARYIAPNNYIYTNPSITFGQRIQWSVYGQQFNTEPDIGDSLLKKLTFITSGDVGILEVIHIDSEIQASGLFTGQGYPLLEFRSGFPGSVTRSRQRLRADV